MRTKQLLAALAALNLLVFLPTSVNGDSIQRDEAVDQVAEYEAAMKNVKKKSEDFSYSQETRECFKIAEEMRDSCMIESAGEASRCSGDYAVAEFHCAQMDRK